MEGTVGPKTAPLPRERQVLLDDGDDVAGGPHVLDLPLGVGVSQCLGLLPSSGLMNAAGKQFPHIAVNM